VFGFGGHKSEFGGGEKGKSWLVWEIEGGLLKSIDSGYASQYSDMLNTYMKMRLYTRHEAQQYQWKWRCEVSNNGIVRLMMQREIT